MMRLKVFQRSQFLIYRIEGGELQLTRTGNHAELF